ncbi:hypothetical protein PYW08_007411 [Mythimna loreyi]|uniref:Uncharacterized protein n=1 Tax=Mythimna loreyi TaxID=667449 RepID=A0ACC2QEC2_9NEOP|nr:hypothetical protein PYW08_007411 [Mythimna loreyi]
MNDPISFCVKRLITEIESRPVIWDSRIKEYSDRSLKKEAWEELCAAFVPYYHESSVGEKNGIIALLQRKWKSVRDAFLRELKKSMTKPQPGIKCAKPYAYFDNLLFLKPVCELRPRKDDDETNFNNNTVTSEYEDNDDSDNNDNSRSNFNESKPEPQPTRKKRKIEDTEDTVLNMLADHMRLKKKRDAHDDPDLLRLVVKLASVLLTSPRSQTLAVKKFHSSLLNKTPILHPHPSKSSHPKGISPVISQ